MAARLEDMDEVALAAAARARSDPGSCAGGLGEGVSEQAAVQTLAERAGRALHASGILVAPMGGAPNIGHFVRRFGPDGYGVRLAGLCDLGEEPGFRRGLAGVGPYFVGVAD